MTYQKRDDKQRDGSTLGDVLWQARMEAGYSIKGLAQMAGVPQSQLYKLENDHVQKPNAAHLAALAEPLGLSLYEVYAAAGIKTPEALANLDQELEDKLRALSPEHLKRLDRYVEGLLDAEDDTDVKPPEYDVDPANN